MYTNFVDAFAAMSADALVAVFADIRVSANTAVSAMF